MGRRLFVSPLQTECDASTRTPLAMLSLVEAALDTISLAGRTGVLVSEVLAKLQRDPDPSVHDFVWRQLRTHAELSFRQQQSGSAIAHDEVSVLELAQIPDGCTAVASERLMLWALRTTKEVWSSVPDDGKLALEAIGKMGALGMLQAVLATTIGVKPNKLFYSVRMPGAGSFSRPLAHAALTAVARLDTGSPPRAADPGTAAHRADPHREHVGRYQVRASARPRQRWPRRVQQARLPARPEEQHSLPLAPPSTRRTRVAERVAAAALGERLLGPRVRYHGPRAAGDDDTDRVAHCARLDRSKQGHCVEQGAAQGPPSVTPCR